MNDDNLIFLKSALSSLRTNAPTTEISMSTIDVAAKNAKNKIDDLEKHIDFLHTKISDMEDRIAMLESIVLNKD